VEKLGKNILHGKSALNISFPVFIFDKITLKMVFSFEQKLKWVTTYLIAFMHFCVSQIKPFNPIIGETFQCKIGILDIYTE
jgi:hypothetical protein